VYELRFQLRSYTGEECFAIMKLKGDQ